MAHYLLARDNLPVSAAFAVMGLGLFFTLANASGPYQITTIVLMSWFVLGVCAYYLGRHYPAVLWVTVPACFALFASMIPQMFDGVTRPTGFTANANHAAGMLTLGIAFLLTRRRAAAPWLALPLAFGVLLTGSRLALLVTAFSFAVTIYQQRQLRLLCVLAIGAALAMLHVDIADGLRLHQNIPGDVTGRVGAGVVPVGMWGQEHGWLFFHNAPLQIAYNAGIPAAMGWIGLVTVTLVYAVRRRSGLMLIVPALLLCTLDHYFWWPGTLAPLFWGFMGASHARD